MAGQAIGNGITTIGEGLVQLGKSIGTTKQKTLPTRSITTTATQRETQKLIMQANKQKSESPVWKEIDNVKGKSTKTKGKGKEKQYYEWDYTHGDIEVYDKNGNHQGSMDPTSGNMYKPPVPGRKIRP